MREFSPSSPSDIGSQRAARKSTAGFLQSVGAVVPGDKALALTHPQVEVPRIAKHHKTGEFPSPATIGLKVQDLAATADVIKSENAPKAQIIGRVGLEKLGRFQHDEVLYQVQLPDSSFPREVRYDDILRHVTLSELERFENAQFEQELIYEDPLAVLPRKRGRPRKTAFAGAGRSTDDESDSNAIEDDGFAIVVPLSSSRKRVLTPSTGRARGRPRKLARFESPSATVLSRGHSNRRGDDDFQHISLPQIKKRVKKKPPIDPDFKTLDDASGTSSRIPLPPFLWINEGTPDLGPGESSDEAEDPINAASDQFIFDLEDDARDNSTDTLPEASQSSIPSSSHFKRSSQLVAVAQESSDDDLDNLHHNFRATKGSGRGKSKFSPSPDFNSENNNNTAILLQQTSVSKPDRVRDKLIRSVVEVKAEDFSSTEDDELADLHQKFGVVRKVASKVPEKNASVKQETPASRTTAPLASSKKKESNQSKPKPGPGQRPGYRKPSIMKQSSITNNGKEPVSLNPPGNDERVLSPPRKSGSISQAVIEISSDDSDSSSIAAPQ